MNEKTYLTTLSCPRCDGVVAYRLGNIETAPSIDAFCETESCEWGGEFTIDHHLTRLIELVTDAIQWEHNLDAETLNKLQPGPQVPTDIYALADADRHEDETLPIEEIDADEIEAYERDLEASHYPDGPEPEDFDDGEWPEYVERGYEFNDPTVTEEG